MDVSNRATELAGKEIVNFANERKRLAEIGKLMEELSGKSVTITARFDGMWEVEGKDFTEIDNTLLDVLQAFKEHSDGCL